MFKAGCQAAHDNATDHVDPAHPDMPWYGQYLVDLSTETPTPTMLATVLIPGHCR